MSFNTNGLMSSDSIEWHTPQYIIEWCQNHLIGCFFSLDVASTNQNKKASSNYTIQQNGLTRPWFGHVWLNPPYGRTIGQWITKAIKELPRTKSITLLIPARTDTRWFFELVDNQYKKHLFFIKGRLSFSQKGSAPFPSVIVHLLPREGSTDSHFIEIDKEVQ